MSRDHLINLHHLGPDGEFIIRPYSRKELASLYGVCSRTFKKWLEPFESEIGPLRGRYYTTTQVKIILDRLSPPSIIHLAA